MIAAAGTSTPNSATRSGMIVITRQPITIITTPAALRIAQRSARKFCAKYISGYPPVNVPRTSSSIQRSKRSSRYARETRPINSPNTITLTGPSQLNSPSRSIGAMPSTSSAMGRPYSSR